MTIKKKSFCHFCGKPLTKKFMEGRQRFFCEQCNLPVYENPVPATCIVVVDEKERVLLVKRSVEPKKGSWCLPGGFMELGETPEKAALRELKEETGLSGKIGMLLGISSNPSAQYNTVLMIGYLVQTFKGDLTAGDDADDARFFQYNRLPEIAFESHENFIKIYYTAYSGRHTA